MVLEPEATPEQFNEHMRDMAARSGELETNDPLVILLYDLLRSDIHPVDIESSLCDIDNVNPGQSCLLCNGWLGAYAMDVAARVTAPLRAELAAAQAKIVELEAALARQTLTLQ
jgi:hypothetical protein